MKLQHKVPSNLSRLRSIATIKFNITISVVTPSSQPSPISNKRLDDEIVLSKSSTWILVQSRRSYSSPGPSILPWGGIIVLDWYVRDDFFGSSVADDVDGVGSDGHRWCKRGCRRWGFGATSRATYKDLLIRWLTGWIAKSTYFGLCIYRARCKALSATSSYSQPLIGFWRGSHTFPPLGLLLALFRDMPGFTLVELSLETAPYGTIHVIMVRLLKPRLAVPSLVSANWLWRWIVLLFSLTRSQRASKRWRVISNWPSYSILWH